jgi:hypothetical protein
MNTGHSLGQNWKKDAGSSCSADWSKAVMNTQQYSFNGQTFLQKAGGPIGLRATCAIARVVMKVWIQHSVIEYEFYEKPMSETQLCTPRPPSVNRSSSLP